MRNARLDEAQAGVKIARRNINKLRYAKNLKKNTSDMQMTPPLCRKRRGTTKPLYESERGE